MRSLPAGAAAPAPVLSPEEARVSFKLPPGFAIELVAAEPLVEAPVAMAFAPDGRIFVVEMRNFMPDVEGVGEATASGRVSVLSDRDGDGRMDERATFLDGLDLPRGVAFVPGGVLIAAAPRLLFCRLDDGTGPCRNPQVVSESYGTRKNPEHDANGFVLGIDNWIYSANHDRRYRFTGGKWLDEATINRGQWGVTQDDFGRLVFNANSDYARGDDWPSYVGAGHLRGARGQNRRLDEDQTIWPGRPNFGVNRGYKDGSLRADGTLMKFTAACGPHVFRGDALSPEVTGNLFVAEPAANLVRRSLLHAQPPEPDERNRDALGSLVARNAHAADNREFLTSSDERFRPVNFATGPDGALYVVDFYRGLIQHRIYLTPFLRQQVKDRGLDRPIDRGRIWRVVRQGDGKANQRAAGDSLAIADGPALIAALGDRNGWRRDTAQRLLIEKNDRRQFPALTRLARSAEDPRVRLHALFAIEGLGAVTPSLLAALARSPGESMRPVRLAARSLGERKLQRKVIELAARLAADPARAPSLLSSRPRGRDLDLLARLTAEPAFAQESTARAALARQLARGIARSRDVDAVRQLAELIVAEPRSVGWRRIALLDGLASGRRDDAPPLPQPPQGWARLLRSDDEAVRTRALALATWLGLEAPTIQRPAARALTPEEKARFERGKSLYPSICGACHQASGLGEEGKGPPLVDSEWVLGPPERLVRIALHGLRGPIRVGNRTYVADMPPMGSLPDDQLAELLTYIRAEGEWGHEAGPIDVAAIVKVRQKTAAREDPWTAEELAKP